MIDNSKLPERESVLLPIYQNVMLGLPKLGRTETRIMLCDCCFVLGEGDDFSGRKLARYLGLDIKHDVMLHFILS